MLVRDFMTTEVVSLEETDTLLDASMIFLRKNYRHLPVLRGKTLVGVITEHDIKQFVPSLLNRMTPEEYNQALETTPVSRVMTRDPPSVAAGQPMFEAASILHTRHIGFLPVVENGELIGVLSTTDMLKLLMRLLAEQGLVPKNSPNSP